jgi:hypothetical protein
MTSNILQRTFIVVLLLLAACRNNPTPLRPVLTQVTPTVAANVLPTPVITGQTSLLPYTHPSNRFSLAYPQSWEPFERPDGVIFIEPQDQAGYGVVFADVGERYTAEQLNQYLVTFIAQNFAREGSNFKAISQEQAADGAVVAQFSSTDPHLGQAISQVKVLQAGTQVFVLHVSAREPQWEVSAEELQELTRQFEVLDVQPAVATPAPGGEAPTWTLIGPQSNEFGFLYADTWQVVAQEENLVSVAQPENQMTFTAENFLWPHSSEGTQAAMEAAETHLETLSKELREVQSLPASEFPLDQVSGATVDFVYVADEGTQMAGSVITGLANGKMHRIVFTAPAEFYEAALQWFNPMYKSFKILAPDELIQEEP